MRRNVAGQFVGIQMVSKTDGSAVTTGTTTVYVTGDAGTQAVGSVGSGACTHEGQGFWTYAPAQAETNYTHVAFTFVNTSAVNATLQIYPTQYDSSGYYNLSSGTGTGQISLSSGLVTLAGVTHTGAVIPTVTTLTGHTAQTGDAFARLGAPAGASVSADVAAVKVDTAAILTDTGTDGVVVAAGSKTGYTLTATTGLGNQTANITGTITTATNVTTVNGLAANVITATSIASDAITDAKVAADVTIASVTGNVGGNVVGSVGSLATQAKADVNAEVVDALATDTYAEPGQGAPAATATLAAKINYLYKAWRNKKTQTTSTYSLFADDTTTVDQKATVSDDGTTTTVGEIATGP